MLTTKLRQANAFVIWDSADSCMIRVIRLEIVSKGAIICIEHNRIFVSLPFAYLEFGCIRLRKVSIVVAVLISLLNYIVIKIGINILRNVL
jgi:hypothetical protein